MNQHRARTSLVAVFALYWMTMTALSLVQLSGDARIPMMWIGMGMASAAPLVFVLHAYFRASSPGRTSASMATTIISALGVAMAMASSWRYGPAAGMGHAGAGLSLIAWVIFLRRVHDRKADPIR